jgi:hypothetical protein
MTKFTFELQSGNHIALTEEELRELIIWCRGDESKVDTIKESLTPKEKPNEEG